MKRSILAAAAVFALALPVSPAVGATIVGLFNTGTDASNVALAGGNGVIDPHYLIFASTSPGFAGNQAVTYFNPAYAAEDGDSRWISLSDSGNPGSNTTSYRLTFDLTGLDPLSAMITGNWGTDNAGLIMLNGVATGDTSNAFNVLAAFSVNSGFVSGINFLDFVVQDFGAPTALRVDDIAGTARELNGAIPEPGTWAMMLLGFGAVGVAIRRRRSVLSATA